MAVRDIEAFIRQRGQAYDSSLDTSPGSPFDTEVVQPIVRRLGTDPFSVDLSTFIATRMQQAFPDMANQEADAITDMLNKPVTLLWDPVVREITRVRQNLSFSDPTSMTADEAEALGANVFVPRTRGRYARGPGRILFQQPQKVDVTPANFFTSRGGLHYFPTEAQSIRTEEMILNITDDGLYYFDVNLIAEAPGTEYNIGPNELISIANVPGATRVTNLRRFRDGETEESTQDFIGRARQELNERSLVTLRGAAAKLVNSFPEISRLNIVGSNDPEMNRDVLKGGGLGSIIAGGNSGTVTADGEGQAKSRRFYTTEVDFVTLLQQQGAVSGYVLTLFDAFGTSTVVQDLDVQTIVSANELDVTSQVLAIGSTSVRWVLRKKELTLSDIPGGILFPDTAAGTLSIPDDEVHVGGMYDVHVRGSGFDEEVFVIDSVTDDEPLLSGLQATIDTEVGGKKVVYPGLRVGVDFELGDSTDQALDNAVRYGYTLQLQDLPAAGNYRVIGRGLNSDPNPSVELFLDPEPTSTTAIEMRWRLFDVINVDLLNPRETKVTGSDLSTLQNSDVVNVGSGTDLDSLGVGEGDTLEVLAGTLEGTYTIVEDPLTPSSVRLDTVLSATLSGLSYRIYRGNTGGQLSPPFVRVTQVELLDTSGQPLGTTIPYAKPVDVQSRAFQNPARGVDHDLRDVRLGLISQSVGTGFAYAASSTLVVYVAGMSPAQRTLTLTTGSADLSTAISELNAEFLSIFGLPEVVKQVGSDKLGIRPVGTDGFVAVVGGTARDSLFGNSELRTTADVRSQSVDDDGGWSALQPSIDTETGLDVMQVLDGYNIGYHAGPFTLGYQNTSLWPSAAVSTALLVGELDDNDYIPASSFAPEQQRRVQVGSRSLGSVRVYFLEPTSFEVDSQTVFSLDLGTEGVVRFVPDPTLEHQRIPALPSNEVPQDGEGAGLTYVFSSASQDFVRSLIQSGDKLVIENMPIEGTVALSDPVVGLVGLTLVLSVDGGSDRTIVFVRDDVTLATNEVSRDGVVDQINGAAGEEIVELTNDYRLRFSTPKNVVVRGTNQGTANSLILGDVANTSGTLTFDSADDVSNESPQAGTYVIDDVDVDLTLDTLLPDPSPFPDPLTEQSFKVYRVGVQRTSATEMAENEAEAGLYYADVELVSEGAGDLWNISADQQLTVVGYRSDGYYLTNSDSELCFSESEEPKLVISRSVLEQGVDDDPSNATQITGENLQVTYERSQTVADVQSYLLSETERVVCSNPLSRHLIPHFIRFDADYAGGSREDVLLTSVEKYVSDLAPTDTLDASDVQGIITASGATYVHNPLELVSVVHYEDRRIWIQRSKDQLSTGRLCSFIPDRITLTRESL